MKNIFIPLIVFSLLTSCVKNYSIQKTGYDPFKAQRDIELFFFSTYLYEIKIENDPVKINLTGQKDPLNRFSVKGYFKILNEKKNLDHIFTGVEWIRIKDFKKDEIEFFDVIDFIENIFDRNSLQFFSYDEKKYIFKVKINTTIFDPVNYLQNGFLTYYPKQKRITFQIENNDNFFVSIEKDNIKTFKILNEYYNSGRLVGGPPENLEMLKKRILEFDIGKITDGILYLNSDLKRVNFDLNMLKEDSLSFYTFDYVLALDDTSGIVYLNFDVRNTVKIKEKILTVAKRNDIYIERHNGSCDILFYNIELSDDRQLVCKLGKFAFFAKYTTVDKILKIRDVNEKFVSFILSVNEFPFDFKNLYFKEVE